LVRFDDLKLIYLIAHNTIKVAAEKLKISPNALHQRLRRLRIKYVKLRLWLNYYEAQKKRPNLRRILTPTEREKEIAKLEYEEALEKMEIPFEEW